MVSNRRTAKMNRKGTPAPSPLSASKSVHAEGSGRAKKLAKALPPKKGKKASKKKSAKG